MGVGTVWRKVRWSVAQRGVGATLRAAVGALRRQGGRVPERVHPFDAQHQTDTGGLIGGGSLATGSRNDAHITAYVAIAPSRLQAGLDRWAASLEAGETVRDFHFVDLGCGKGRAVLLASERPFRSVTGVELHPGLAAIARRNAEVMRSSGAVLGVVNVICGDATEFLYPPGPLLVFLYNPFGSAVLRAVLAALQRHVEATGARVDVLFQNEAPEMALQADTRLRLLWTGSLPLGREDAEAELVGSAGDVTSLYRWVG